MERRTTARTRSNPRKRHTINALSTHFFEKRLYFKVFCFICLPSLREKMQSDTEVLTSPDTHDATWDLVVFSVIRGKAERLAKASGKKNATESELGGITRFMAPSHVHIKTASLLMAPGHRGESGYLHNQEKLLLTKRTVWPSVAFPPLTTMIQRLRPACFFFPRCY